jgi:protoporphyrinogen oxidase
VSAGEDRPTDCDVLIVGAGIAGLAAALRARALDPRLRIVLADADSRIGGKIAGEIVDGCVVDGGPDVCIGDKLRSTRLFDDLGLAARALRVNPRRLPTFELHDGTLRPAATSFAGELLTFPGGIRELIDTACTSLSDVQMVTDWRITTIRAADGRWLARGEDGTSYVASTVIIATPASAAAAMLAGVASPEAAALASLEYPPTTTVTMAWARSDVTRPLDGTGYLATDAHAAFRACTWVSSKNPTHAHADIVLLRGYISATPPDAEQIMRREAGSVLGITASPLFSRTYAWPAGIPTYTASHEAAVRALELRLGASPGVFIAGSAFHGVGIPDCIHSGERAAAAAVAHIGSLQKEQAA